MKPLRTAIFLAIAASPALSAFAQAAAADPAPVRTSLWDIVKTGGWAMYPLGACSLALLSMIVLNLLIVSRRNLMPPATIGTLRACAAKRDVGQIVSVCRTTPCLFTNGLVAGLRKLDVDDPAASKQDVENGVAEAVTREEAQVSFWINFLSLITGVAPMIGLLGTVSGMIGAFQKIGAGGMGKPEQLAGNIGEALITTATGLCIAIPAMFAYFIFRNNLSRIVRDAEGEYSFIIDNLTGAADLFAQIDGKSDE